MVDCVTQTIISGSLLTSVSYILCATIRNCMCWAAGMHRVVQRCAEPSSQMGVHKHPAQLMTPVTVQSSSYESNGTNRPEIEYAEQILVEEDDADVGKVPGSMQGWRKG